MSNTVEDNVSNWGIVELMGHKVVAGLISKSEILGKPLLRVDVPATSAYGEFTQFYGEAAIYCVTFTSEQVAKLTAEQIKVNPVGVWVPELITREKHEEALEHYKKQIERLKQGALPAPAGNYTAPADGSPWQDDDSDDEDDDPDF